MMSPLAIATAPTLPVGPRPRPGRRTLDTVRPPRPPEAPISKARFRRPRFRKPKFRKQVLDGVPPDTGSTPPAAHTGAGGRAARAHALARGLRRPPRGPRHLPHGRRHLAHQPVVS